MIIYKANGHKGELQQHPIVHGGEKKKALELKLAGRSLDVLPFYSLFFDKSNDSVALGRF